MQSLREDVELPMKAITASGEDYMLSDLYLEHHAARSCCLHCHKWYAPALLTVRKTRSIPTVTTVPYCIVYIVLEYNAYSTITGSQSAQEVIYVRNRPRGGGYTPDAVHKGWYIVSKALCRPVTLFQKHNEQPPAPYFSRATPQRLLVEGMSKFCFSPLAWLSPSSHKY